MCGPNGGRLDTGCRRTLAGPIPGRDRVRIIVAGAPPPTRTIARVRTELGWEFIQIYGLTETAPLITMNRFRSEWAGLDVQEQARMLGRAGAPAIGVRVSVAEDGEVLTQSNTNLTDIGISRRPLRRHWRAIGFIPVIADRWTTDT